MQQRATDVLFGGRILFGYPRVTKTKAGENAHKFCVGSADGRLKDRE